MVILVSFVDPRSLEISEPEASRARLERKASEGSVERMCVEGCANAVLMARAAAQNEEILNCVPKGKYTTFSCVYHHQKHSVMAQQAMQSSSLRLPETNSPVSSLFVHNGSKLVCHFLD